MVPDEGQAALVHHLAHCIFMEVFKYEAMEVNPQAVKDLIASDNFDHDFGLGDTETRLLLSIKAMLTITRPPVGKSQFEIIMSAVKRSAGQAWSHDDIASLYNFAKVVGDLQLDTLDACVQAHVDLARTEQQ